MSNAGHSKLAGRRPRGQRQGARDVLKRVSWRTIGFVFVDAATVAFGDLDVVGPLLPIEVVPDGPLAAKPTALVVQTTGEDCDLPLEVALQGRRRIAARLEFAKDVANLEGRWVTVGHLVITRGHAVACDPHCEDSVYRIPFRIPRGRYIAEVFESSGSPRKRPDILGLRIRRDGDQ